MRARQILAGRQGGGAARSRAPRARQRADARACRPTHRQGVRQARYADSARLQPRRRGASRSGATWRASRSAIASLAPAPASPITPRSTRCRRISACAFPRASTTRTRASSRSAPSRCRASVTPRRRSARRVVVMGLGLIGLLTVQILKANGCRVIGFDPNPARAALARRTRRRRRASSDGFAGDRGRGCTGGLGADAVIVTASSKSSEPINHGRRDQPPQGPHRRRRPRRHDDRSRAVLQARARAEAVDVLRAGPRRSRPTRSPATTIRCPMCAGPSSATWRPSSASSRTAGDAEGLRHASLRHRRGGEGL